MRYHSICCGGKLTRRAGVDRAVERDVPGFGISKKLGELPEVGRFAAGVDGGGVVFGGEEEGVIWFTVLEKSLVLELPAEDIEDGLDEVLLQTGFVVVLGSQGFLRRSEGREFGESFAGGSAEGRVFRLISETMFEPVVGKELRIADGAKGEV